MRRRPHRRRIERTARPDRLATSVRPRLDFVATLTPMHDEAVAAVVHSIVDAGVVLSGLNGEAAFAGHFAGQWRTAHL